MDKAGANEVSVIYTSRPPATLAQHEGKVFALVGPFDGYADKARLQEAINATVRRWNRDRKAKP